MSDYPRSAGETLTDEQRQYYRSNSSDAIQLREDLCKALGICLTAAVAAIIANYSSKGGTRKRSRRSSRNKKSIRRSGSRKSRRK